MAVTKQCQVESRDMLSTLVVVVALHDVTYDDRERAKQQKLTLSATIPVTTNNEVPDIPDPLFPSANQKHRPRIGPKTRSFVLKR